MNEKKFIQMLTMVIDKVFKTKKAVLWQNATIVSLDIVNGTAVVKLNGDTNDISVKIQTGLSGLSVNDTVRMLIFKGSNTSNNQSSRLIIDKLN